MGSLTFFKHIRSPRSKKFENNCPKELVKDPKGVPSSVSSSGTWGDGWLDSKILFSLCHSSGVLILLWALELLLSFSDGVQILCTEFR